MAKKAKKKPARKPPRGTRAHDTRTGHPVTPKYEKGHKATTVRVRAARAIWQGWIEVDDDGVPNGDPATGDLVVYKNPSASHGEWRAQYVRLVKARVPRGRG